MKYIKVEIYLSNQKILWFNYHQDQGVFCKLFPRSYLL